jgi:hypothetical protein
MLRKTLFLAFTFAVLVSSVSAQEAQAKPNPRLSIDLNYGIPVTFFSINSGLVAIYGVGARYSITPTISVAAKYNSFAFVNNKTGNSYGALSSTPVSSKDVIRYNNKFKSLNVYVQYNLHKLFGMDQLTSKFIPYVTVGGGYLVANKYSLTLVDGLVYRDEKLKFSPWIKNYQFGLGVRYYLSSFVDLTLGSEYNSTESYYLDAAYSDKKLDTYLNTYLGVNVKIGANKSHNLIDWKHKDEPEEVHEKYDFSRISGDVHLGFPVLFTGIGYSPSLGGGLNARYSLTRGFSLQGNLGWYKYRGSQDVGSTLSAGSIRENADIKHFNTLVTNFGVRALFNLNQIGEKPSEKRVWNHYVSLGVGIDNFSQDLDFAGGTSVENIKYRWKTSNAVLGYQARKYITSEYDFMAGIDINYNQTYWLDGAPKDSKLDNSMYLFAGVSYKLDAKGGKELIDWTYGNYNWTEEKRAIPLAQVPVLDQPTIEEQPKNPEVPKAPEPVIEAPKAPEPVVEAPKAPEPVIETPKAAVPVEAPQVIESPKVTPTPKPKVTPTAPVNPSAPYVANSEIAPPPMKYNVIVACYGASKESIALLAKAKLEKKGYTPSLYQDENSRMLRMALISTDSKAEAMEILRKARKDVDANSWIHLYNKQ